MEIRPFQDTDDIFKARGVSIETKYTGLTYIEAWVQSELLRRNAQQLFLQWEKDLQLAHMYII